MCAHCIRAYSMADGCRLTTPPVVRTVPQQQSLHRSIYSLSNKRDNDDNRPSVFTHQIILLATHLRLDTISGTRARTTHQRNKAQARIPIFFLLTHPPIPPLTPSFASASNCALRFCAMFTHTHTAKNDQSTEAAQTKATDD